MSDVKLIHGDCINEMQKLNDINVDLILTDLPYGTTECKWDVIIPFEDMWNCINQVSHERTPILLFGIEPFSSYLRVSNINCYKYDWVWDKGNSANFMNCKIQPLKPLEYISVFYKRQPKYYPIRRPKTITYDGTRVSDADKAYRSNESLVCGNRYSRRFYIDDGTRYPINLISFNSQQGECNNSNRVHPTQKPVELLEYLIKTYTDEGDTVLDFTMGSGSTGVACKSLNRNFIGIESDIEYYNIAVERIKDIQTKLCN